MGRGADEDLAVTRRLLAHDRFLRPTRVQCSCTILSQADVLWLVALSWTTDHPVVCFSAFPSPLFGKASRSLARDCSCSRRGHPGCLVVTLIIAAILLFRIVRARRQKMAPSAYRNIHDAEMSEPKVALYDAEGGRSRYADPYSDQH